MSFVNEEIELLKVNNNIMKNIFFTQLFISLSLLLFLACQPKNNKVEDIPVEKTIRIDSELSKKYKGDCDKMIDIESVSLIPLKMPKDDLIGNIKKILFVNDTIVILDIVRESVLFFDEKGNFLSKISRKGRGPGEYLSISNISITTPDTLNVLDLLVRSVKQYSFSGDFLREKKLDKWGYPSGYLKLGAYEYFAVYSAYLAEEKELYYLNIHGENGKKTGYFPFMEMILASTEPATYFFTDGESWYYRQFFDDTIYRLEDGKLIAAYRFDFGENAYPGEALLESKTTDDYDRLLSRKKYVGNIFNIHATKEYLHFQYTDGEPEVANYILNLKTNMSYHYKASTLCKGMMYLLPFSPISSDGTYFYGVYDPGQVDDNDNLEKLNSKYGLKLTPESERVLVKYKYKGPSY